MTWTNVIILLGVLLCAWAPSSVSSQATPQINSFEMNLDQGAAQDTKPAQQNEFQPPPSEKSTFKWVSSTFGQCFGCGTKSYKHVTHDCVHRLEMQLTVGSYSKTLMGVFKAPESECLKRNIRAPAPVNLLGCGPPCSEVRLLRGANTGCRCDHSRKMSYDVPKLVCQDNRNRTVSLALCKFNYEKNTADYQPKECDYSVVCTSKIGWIAGNWSMCSHENSVHQSRNIVCAANPPGSNVYYVMHESMCTGNRPDKMQFCARWVRERSFSPCNCASRQSTRRVICRRAKIMVPESECGWHIKPESIRRCTC